MSWIPSSSAGCQELTSRMTLSAQVDPGLVVSHRGCRQEVAVFGDAADLDDGHVEVAEEPLPHHLRDVRQVHVHVVERPALSWRGCGVRLVGHAQASRRRRLALRPAPARSRPRPDADAERITLLGRVGLAVQRLRNRLGVARAGEPAHPNVGAWRDESSRLVCCHHLGSGSGILYSRVGVTGRRSYQRGPWA